MADFYDIDFNLQTENLINPLHRAQENLDYMGSVTAELQYLRDILLGDYREGSNYSAYSAVVPYVPGNRVQFEDKSVYENILASTGIKPGTAVGDTYWRKLQNNFIGATERVKYNGQIILLLTAFNRWFQTSSGSYIYLTNNNVVNTKGYTLYVPLALYNSLASTNPQRDLVLMNFAYRYMASGIYITVSTY